MIIQKEKEGVAGTEPRCKRGTRGQGKKDRDRTPELEKEAERGWGMERIKR